MSDLIRRARALDAAKRKYGKRAFSWRNAVSCVHLARSHLVRMGHRPPPLPRIRSLVGARRALAERGWADVTEMLDAQPGLLRIAPAEMLPGDLAVLASEDAIGAIFVCAGPHKLIGWREDAPAMVVLDLSFDLVSGAWRV
jgi:hypothetical protein